MNTLTAKTTEQVRAKSVRVTANTLHVRLDDGGKSACRSPKYLAEMAAQATPKQRANWSLEPGGYAIYWPDLDDGIEVCHLLDSQPIA
jgi:hypothetical protein